MMFNETVKKRHFQLQWLNYIVLFQTGIVQCNDIGKQNHVSTDKTVLAFWT